jgi:hypothetical protein
MPLSPLR